MNAFEKLERNGLSVNIAEVQRICTKYQIIELSIFGSALREDFNEDSDIDLLVSYHASSAIDLIDEFHIQNEFTQVLNRKIDILAIDDLTNPIRRRKILESREIIYANT